MSPTEQFNEAALGARWYAVVNDLYGGWAVCTVDQPLSSLEGHRTDFYIAAEATTLEVAEHIARLHNDWHFDETW